ncbi:glutamate receptor ionotropic, delta-2-like [Penaeus japonicus]|uniref:glutamate receptor ionotropic, delta-2-like n=1 Tax=Penaeus japonicus TaxID=27405 RepID=UPI001C70E581|nr:glutamate receptor ionotropic, delta-2-like [Penaeus japonicus]
MALTSSTGNSSCLRIAVADDRLFLIVSKGPPYKISGVLVEIMAIIANYMGVCYEWVVPKDGLYGYMLPNGTWTGMLGLVNRSVRRSVSSLVFRYFNHLIFFLTRSKSLIEGE